MGSKCDWHSMGTNVMTYQNAWVLFLLPVALEPKFANLHSRQEKNNNNY